MKLLRILTLVALATRTLAAQSPAPAKPTGTVTGHVILGDSHLPARMVSVTLIPVPAADSATAKPSAPPAGNVETSPDGSFTIRFKPNDGPSAASVVTVSTLLDGSFSIPNVLPGQYYLIAGKRGYVSPLPFADFTPSRISKDQAETLAALLTPLGVAANRTTTVDTTLVKGAAISGTVQFDDGAPASETLLQLMRKDKTGKWANFSSQPDGFMEDVAGASDDQGHFRLSGLPAGEYLLKASLIVDGGTISENGGGSMLRNSYSLDIYYGEGIRQKDAKPIKVTEGEQSEGNNIEIPLAKLHAVSGTVVSSETGATVNSARVELLFADDNSVAAETDTSWDGNEFRFLFVPEGTYSMQVTKAADVIRGPVAGYEEPIRSYADASQSLIVKGETNGITVQVKPMAPAATAATQ